MTRTLMKPTKIFELFILCLLTKLIYGKTLHIKQDERVKRGYGYYGGGNDFGSSVQVSSGVLQYSGGDEQLNVDSLDSGSPSAIGVQHTESLTGSADPWAATGLSSGYDMWLEPLTSFHGNSASSTSGISNHPGSDHIVNQVFSDNLAPSVNFALPSSQLHTQISSSSSIGNSAADIGSSTSFHDHGAVAINDNVDFNNDADINIKHFAKSYGK